MHQNIDDDREESRPEDDHPRAEDAAPAAEGEEKQSEPAATPTEKKRKGRPRALGDEEMSNICILINAGCSKRYAARYVGCSHATILNQMRRDKGFALRVRKAEAQRQIGSLQHLRQHGERSWRAAAWFLERTDREQFGRQLIEVAPWQEIEKLFRSWTQFNLESVEDKSAREKMQVRADELLGEVRRCQRRY